MLAKTSYVTLVVVCTLTLASHAADQCRSPRYQIAGGFGAAVHIALQRSDFTVAKLVCLAQSVTLQSATGERPPIFIFDSASAAGEYQPQRYHFTPTTAASFRHLRALVDRRATDGHEILIITPFGFRDVGDYDTIIELPPTTAPRCRLALDSRCLIALEPVANQGETQSLKFTGNVTLSGIVSREGGVTRISVDEANSSSAEGKAWLVREAMNNLRTWWLEAAPREGSVRVTYNFGTGVSPTVSEGVELFIEHPKSQITITAVSRKRG